MITLKEISKTQIEAVFNVRGENRADINNKVAAILNTGTTNYYHNVGNNSYNRVAGFLPTISKDKVNKKWLSV